MGLLGFVGYWMNLADPRSLPGWFGSRETLKDFTLPVFMEAQYIE